MQILIPAAGLGKQIGAETADRTKVMVPMLEEGLSISLQDYKTYF